MQKIQLTTVRGLILSTTQIGHDTVHIKKKLVPAYELSYLARSSKAMLDASWWNGKLA